MQQGLPPLGLMCLLGMLVVLEAFHQIIGVVVFTAFVTAPKSRFLFFEGESGGGGGMKCVVCFKISVLGSLGFPPLAIGAIGGLAARGEGRECMAAGAEDMFAPIPQLELMVRRAGL